jgi:tetratricopeptide (TPR) repeat protein
LNEIDVGIAPLKDTAFNRCRSDVKFLEYGVHGVVPVMAHLEPYLQSVRDGVTGFVYRAPCNLVEILDRLVCDPHIRIAAAQAARRYVLTERLQKDHRQERLDFYGDLVRETGLMDNGESCRKQFSSWTVMDGAVTTGRYLQLEECEFEFLLGAGLVEMQVEKNNQKAWQHFAQAADLEPQNYLPYLFGSSVIEDRVGVLFKAIERHPGSLRAWVLLGEAFARKGKIREAMDCYTTATKVFPDYEIPYLRLGGLLKQIGRNAESANSFEKAKSLFLQSFPTALAS